MNEEMKRGRGRPKKEVSDAETSGSSTSVIEDANPAKEDDGLGQTGESPVRVKRLIWRAKDKSLRLIWKSAYTVKERGESEYFPSEGVQFNDWQLFLDDTPENRKTIQKLEAHPSNGFTFRLEPQESLTDSSPVGLIEELEKMVEEELRERCRKKDIVVTPQMTKEGMIIELMKVLTK